MKKSNTHDAKIMDSIDMLQRAVEQMNEQFRQFSQRPTTIINNYGSGDVIADGGKKIVYATCNSAEHMGEKKDAAEGDASAEEDKNQLAMAIWKELQESGFIGHDFMPAPGVTKGMAGYIARWFGRILKIRNFCVVFGEKWNCKPNSLSKSLNKAMETSTLTPLIEALNGIEEKLGLSKGEH